MNSPLHASGPSPRVLVVDDEADLRELVMITLMRMGVDATPAGDLAQANAALDASRFDLCLTDMRLPDGDGIDLVRRISTQFPQLPVAMITAFGSVETAIEAMKAGAFDFIAKPLELERLRSLVSSALRLKETAAEAGETGGTGRALLGESAPIVQMRATIAKLARSQAPVFVSGESGTGKELVARLIHEQGPRAAGPFVPVNCGAVVAELMESEFFGHRKGSFTGAVTDKEGLFQAADGGTLFLDEVADLPLSMQVKLLRAIQEKAVRPVGEQKEISVDVRILSASHKDLDALVASEKFRQDLYYRLNVIKVDVPPLRERPGDIAVLVRHLLARMAGQGMRVTLSDAALVRLESHGFPGNVRELENVLERAAALCENERIEVDDLGLAVPPAAPMEYGARIEADKLAALQPTDAASPEGDETVLEESSGLDSVLEEVEKRRIVKALERSRYNKTKAAKLLGLSFGSLRYRMQKLGLDD